MFGANNFADRPNGIPLLPASTERGVTCIGSFKNSASNFGPGPLQWIELTGAGLYVDA
jgi:hypothetical protein